MLWHIMKIYSHFGINDFIICLGYKGYVIKEYFANYHLHNADLTIDIGANTVEYRQRRAEPWRITLIDTGGETMTGGRIRRVRDYIGDEDFCMTYGDGVANINIRRLIDFHQSCGRKATVTAVSPPGRFGSLDIGDDYGVRSFVEKPQGDGHWINGGFFVLAPSVIDLIADDHTVFEKEPLVQLAASGELSAYRHDGFWHAMDTLRDKRHLEELWTTGQAAWKIW